MVGEIDSVSQLPSDRSCIFRTTNSNWDGVLPSTYTPYARFRSSHSGAYSFWLGVDTDQKMWFARHLPNDGIPTISEWHEVAVAEPPQKFTAPLSDGYSGALSYLKTQESIVIVSFDVYKTDNSTINGTNLISTLPEGFRGVSGYCVALATGVEGGSIVGAAQAWCDTEGIVRTLCPSGTYRIRGEIIFCAN